MRCVERVKVGVEGDVLSCDPNFVFCGVDAVSQNVPVGCYSDECSLDAGQAEALILELAAIDMKASEGAERGNA